MDRRLESGRSLSRRGVVRSLGVLGVGALVGTAGCTDGGSGDPGTEPGTTTTTDDENDATTRTTDDESTGTEEGPSFARWRYDTGHDELGTLTLAPGADGPAVYVGSAHDAASGDGHALHAISLPDGSEQWRLDLPHAVRTTPIYGGDDGPERIYFATGPESLHGRDVEFRAVDPGRGETAWTFDSEDRRFLLPLASSDDAVFVGRRDDQIGPSGENVYALEADGGDERWRIESGDAKTGGHAVRRDTALLATRGHLHARAVDGGERRWQYDAEGILEVAYDNRAERVFVGDDDVVRALALEDGTELWRREFDFTVSRVTSPRAAMDDTVFVGDYDGRLLALSPLEGDTRWTLEVGRDQFYPQVERTSERLFVGGAAVHALDPVSGEREWSFGTDRRGSFGISVGRTVFARNGPENRLYALDPDTGDRRWRFAPEQRMVGLETPGDLAVAAVGGAVLALDGSEEV